MTCECGCGESIPEITVRRYPQRFVKGHNSRHPWLPAPERFWPKVNKNGPLAFVHGQWTPCWIWTGLSSFTKWGRYGQFQFEGRLQGAHRVAWILTCGPIPSGLTIDHLCRNTLCVNSGHLEPVPIAENTRRGFSQSVLNAAKTHCPNGHLLAEPNLVRAALLRGQRNCRTCAIERERERRRRVLYSGGPESLSGSC